MILPDDTREELRYLPVYNEITMDGTTMNVVGSKCIIFPTRKLHMMSHKYISIELSFLVKTEN